MKLGSAAELLVRTTFCEEEYKREYSLASSRFSFKSHPSFQQKVLGKCSTLVGTSLVPRLSL